MVPTVRGRWQSQCRTNVDSSVPTAGSSQAQYCRRAQVPHIIVGVEHLVVVDMAIEHLAAVHTAAVYLAIHHMANCPSGYLPYGCCP